MKKIYSLSIFILMPCLIFAQSTFGSISGKVLYQEKLVFGALIILTDEGTQTSIQTNSNKSGTYGFYQLKSSSNYSLKAIYPLADTVHIEFIQIIVGEDVLLNIPFQSKVNELNPIQVNSSSNSNKNASSIDLLKNTTIKSNELSRLLMHHPEAYIKPDNSGAASFSGQNNRFNSYYIDGVLQNDQFGLSPTGTIMGETGNLAAAPESFEQMQLLVSPYDASLGNFTGAAINIVTKAGKNKPFQEAYTTLRTNRHLYKHIGMSIGGPIVYKKLFYFINTDQLDEYILRPFSINKYQGKTNQIDKLNRFRQTLQERFGYDPGILDQIVQSRSNKWAFRLDGNLNPKNQFVVNVRTSKSFRNSNTPSSQSMLIFSNNGKIQQQKNTSVSIEWKNKITSLTQNRLLLSYNRHSSITTPKLQAFPLIRLLDGEGMIVLGASEETYLNQLSQTSYGLNNRWSTLKGKHFWELGIDADYTIMKNKFMLNGNGEYFYYDISHFLQNRNPVEFSINRLSNLSSKEELSPTLNVLKWAYFINYKINLTKNIQLHGGLRWNEERFLNEPQTDSFMNNTAIPKISRVHHLDGSISGKLPRLLSTPSPRIYSTFFIPQWNMNLKIGAGIFTGRIPYAWLSGIYSNNGSNIEQYISPQNQIRNYPFNPNNTLVNFLPPQNHTVNKGTIYISAAKLKLPAIFRSTVQLSKSIFQNTIWSMQFMYFKNLTELIFSNVNINNANAYLESPDTRLIHAPTNTLKIPINQDGSNPYDYIILSKNSNNQRGYGYELSIQLKHQQKQSNSFIKYLYGNAFSLFDGNYSITLNHWRLMEQTNGRNNIKLSTSDYSQGHRIYAEYRLQIKQPKNKRFSGSIHYNGQSGTPFSYVYGKGNISGDDPTVTGYDLIYIPREAEINKMHFEPIFKNEKYYTSDQQQEALNNFISSNKYLQKRRGLFAQRNGSRAPFTHRIDIKANWYIPIKIHAQKIHLNLSIEILNAANLLNASWGQQLQVAGGRVKLISFHGFKSNQSLTPIYSFDPALLEQSIFELNNSLNPANSSNWMLQLGFKLSFY
ncbi:MAG TPA: hypothetical protein PLC18_03275 [Sediminibacterium sp.]|uniref:hypothetical protein n=1 Tax=Sediminibacterium sp. TaxID=1917865 RepID=UPI002B953BD8|nr:hypothetical protein [Sediminibacterium sp.]HQS34404.1 hypothetical protein [Sediminibacterium sp.]